MKTYQGISCYHHDSVPTTGILLVNLGTPDEPTPAAVRRYLAEFLADPRITEMPRWLWYLILHGIILRVRPRRSALNYQKIWTEQGSPLLTLSQALAQALEHSLAAQLPAPVKVALGMRYGKPAIETALEQLRQAQARHLLILPLYPQYSATTTASTFDAVSAVLQRWRWLPDIRFIAHYHDFSFYIQALATHIRTYWQQYGAAEKLLFSFHGIPQRFFLAGDPYFCQCHKTARLVSEQLALADQHWQVVFQSRFGREPWLQPYLDHTLIELAQTGSRHVDVICPGFATDCLETLEEINRENRQRFLHAGGQVFRYLPALNHEAYHVHALAELIKQQIQGWPLASLNELQQLGMQQQKRALKLGAPH